VNFVRTIKDVLGIPYFGITDGTAEPMADLFDMTQTSWTYNSIVPGILRTATTLPLPTATASNTLPNTKRNRAATKPRHSAVWWARALSARPRIVQDAFEGGRPKGAIIWLLQMRGFRGGR
jgi:hypothetical protein